MAIFRYGAGILYWEEIELKELDRNSRKTMTKYGALHPKSDVDRLYMKRKEGGRGLMSVEWCAKVEETVWIFMLPIQMTSSSGVLLQLGQSIRKILS